MSYFVGYVPEDVDEEELARKARECENLVVDYERGSIICADTGEVLSLGAPTSEYYMNLPRNTLFTNAFVVKPKEKKLAEALMLYLRGYSIKDIVKRTGIRSIKELYEYLRSNGVRMRKKKRYHRKLTPKEIEEIIRKYEEGRSIYSLAKEYNLSTSRIYNIVHRRCVTAATSKKHSKQRKRKQQALKK